MIAHCMFSFVLAKVIPSTVDAGVLLSLIQEYKQLAIFSINALGPHKSGCPRSRRSRIAIYALGHHYVIAERPTLAHVLTFPIRGARECFSEAVTCEKLLTTSNVIWQTRGFLVVPVALPLDIAGRHAARRSATKTQSTRRLSLQRRFPSGPPKGRSGSAKTVEFLCKTFTRCCKDVVFLCKTCQLEN